MIDALLQRLYGHFNAALFGGALPPCSVRVAAETEEGLLGQFFLDDDLSPPETEIVLYPRAVHELTLRWFASVLVHEMVHLHQVTRPEWDPDASDDIDHDAAWVAKMHEIGLPARASDGYHVIDPDGAFQRAFADLPTTLFLALEPCGEPTR